MTKKEIQLPTGVTQEAVMTWKGLYGQNNVKMAVLQDDDGNELRTEIVRVPDRKTCGEWEKWLDKNPLKSKEVLVNACLLSNKEAVKADDVLFASAYRAIESLVLVGKFKFVDF